MTTVSNRERLRETLASGSRSFDSPAPVPDSVVVVVDVFDVSVVVEVLESLGDALTTGDSPSYARLSRRSSDAPSRYAVGDTEWFSSRSIRRIR